MITVKDISWLAGLLEGEGSFSDETGSPRIQLKMTDWDIVDRAREMMKSETLETVLYDNPNFKTAYVTRVQGNPAIQWMMTIFSLMGKRRRIRIAGILERWKVRDRRDKGVDTCKRGHRLLRYGYDFKYSVNSNGSESKKCVQCQKIYNATHPRRHKVVS